MSPSLSKIITVIASFVSINKYCLFKQFKDVYDKVTDTIHGINAKSSEITDIFPRLSLPSGVLLGYPVCIECSHTGK